MTTCFHKVDLHTILIELRWLTEIHKGIRREEILLLRLASFMSGSVNKSY